MTLVLKNEVATLSSSKVIIWTDTDRQIDRQTDRRTDRLHWNYYLPHTRMVIKTFYNDHLTLNACSIVINRCHVQISNRGCLFEQWQQARTKLGPLHAGGRPGHAPPCPVKQTGDRRSKVVKIRLNSNKVAGKGLLTSELRRLRCDRDTNGVFTFSGPGTETGTVTGARTMENSGFQPLSCFQNVIWKLPYSFI